MDASFGFRRGVAKWMDRRAGGYGGRRRDRSIAGISRAEAAAMGEGGGAGLGWSGLEAGLETWAGIFELACWPEEEGWSTESSRKLARAPRESRAAA